MAIRILASDLCQAQFRQGLEDAAKVISDVLTLFIANFLQFPLPLSGRGGTRHDGITPLPPNSTARSDSPCGSYPLWQVITQCLSSSTHGRSSAAETNKFTMGLYTPRILITLVQRSPLRWVHSQNRHPFPRENARSVLLFSSNHGGGLQLFEILGLVCMADASSWMLFVDPTKSLTSALPTDPSPIGLADS